MPPPTALARKPFYAARRAEDLTVAQERVPHGRWFWMLTPSAEDQSEVGTAPHP
jgi:hypothetical protein